MYKVHTIWTDVLHMTNQTIAMEAFREILHIFEHLPEEIKSCADITKVLEKLAKRIILLFDIIDFAKKATNNLIYHSFEILG